MTPPVRLLDFGAPDPFLKAIGRPRTLAWPVQVHWVTLPITSTAGHGYLNPFERVILKVIDAVGDLDEAQLSAETCIPVDLVRSVVCRLQDRGLVDGANAIVDAQRKTWDRDALEEVDYQSALLFRDLVGGRLIPFLYALDDRTPIRTEEVGRRAWTLPRGHLGRLEPPSTGDVIKILGQMKRRSAVQGTSMRLPAISQIRVIPEPEDYYLSCAIAIQGHDADFRIADPFGTGYSQVLEEVFDSRLDTDEKLQGWMNKWRTSLESSTRTDARRARERFDTSRNRKQYPNLIKALTPAAGALHRTVEDIYAALEWALFYCCETHGPDVALRRLGLSDDSDHSRRLSDIAAQLGFERPVQGFRPVPKGKLDDYLSGRPELETVLAIALMQAELDSDHPMRSLASAHPDFIIRVRTLASDRGDRAHGQRVTPTSDVELASDPFMRDSISTLLPAIQFGSNAATSETSPQTDLRLEARNKLLQSFGYRRFKELGPSAQASLQSAEMFLLTCSDGDDARSFVSDLYSALQAVLRNFLGDVAPVDIPTWEYTKRAARNADDAGLGTLPKSLASVNPRRIEDALRGNDRSLGASVMSFLLTAGPETLKEVQFQKPDLLEFLARISSMRGHANQPVQMQRTDMRTLSRSTVATVNMLLDLIRED